MWEEDRARLLTLHPDTWAGMLSNNELSVGYVEVLSLILIHRSFPPSLLSLSLSLSSLSLSLCLSVSLTYSHPQLYNRTEQKLYNCVMTFAAQFDDDQKKKDEVLTLLLPCIRFNFMPIDFLLNTYVLINHFLYECISRDI